MSRPESPGSPSCSPRCVQPRRAAESTDRLRRPLSTLALPASVLEFWQLPQLRAPTAERLVPLNELSALVEQAWAEAVPAAAVGWMVVPVPAEPAAAAPAREHSA